MQLTIILFWTDNLSCLNGGATSLIKARLTARNQLLISSCQLSLSFFERKARAVRTDDSFYQMDSLSYSNRWHCFFKRTTRSVWTDNNFFRTDRQSCSDQGLIKYQIFAEISLSQLSVISCNTKFTGFVVVVHNARRFAMGL